MPSMIGDFFSKIKNDIKLKNLQRKIRKGYICGSCEDYLNRYHTRNVENTGLNDYNCGGYALKTFNWYQPTRLAPGEVYNVINEMGYSGYHCEEIHDWYLEQAKKQMLEDFPSLIEVPFYYKPKQYERLIAFRMGLTYDEEEESWEYDFHYRFKDYDKIYWEEKRGSTMPRICEGDVEDPWDWWRGVYDSKILYFCLPITP